MSNSSSNNIYNNLIKKINTIDSTLNNYKTSGPYDIKYQIGLQGGIDLTNYRGPTGPVGVNGPYGLRGPTGQVGPTGLQGDTGPVGIRGPTGPAGPTGPQGPISTGTAQQGPQGPNGLAGPQGPIGTEQGPTGPQGNAGPRGPSGPWVDIGPQGDIGPTGLQGPQGPKGATGPTGTSFLSITGVCKPNTWISIPDGNTATPSSASIGYTTTKYFTVTDLPTLPNSSPSTYSATINEITLDYVGVSLVNIWIKIEMDSAISFKYIRLEVKPFTGTIVSSSSLVHNISVNVVYIYNTAIVKHSTTNSIADIFINLSYSPTSTINSINFVTTNYSCGYRITRIG